MRKIKWGIIGSGKIARRFASDLKLLSHAELTGVTSRNPDNSLNFSNEFKTKSYPTINDLLSSDVDVIYIATPHSSHREHALMAMEAGKAVLCEKPFAMNSDEATEMFEFARSRNVFIMEGMWTRFFPAIQECLDLVNTGAIGKIQRIESSFGYQSAFNPKSRIYDPALGGGSLLDVGVYTIAIALMFIGDELVQIESSAKLSSTSVDESTEWKMTFSSGEVAFGRSSVVEVLPNEALIIGDTGQIRIPRFWHPDSYYLNDVFKTLTFPGMGFQFEAEEVMNSLRNRKSESTLWNYQNTIAVMKIMDEIRIKSGGTNRT